MPKGKDIHTLLRPVRDVPLQAYFGQGLHTLGLLNWLLPQTGKADVWVSSYSTSEPFLNGFCLLRQKDLVRHFFHPARPKGSTKDTPLRESAGCCLRACPAGAEPLKAAAGTELRHQRVGGHLAESDIRRTRRKHHHQYRPRGVRLSDAAVPGHLRARCRRT